MLLKGCITLGNCKKMPVGLDVDSLELEQSIKVHIDWTSSHDMEKTSCIGKTNVF